MTQDHPFLQHMLQLTEQASSAIFRIIGNQYMPHPGVLGSIELSRAIEDCRTGVGKEMLKKLTFKGWDIRHPKIDKSEYKEFIEPKELPLITKKAQRILHKAARFALDQKEQYAGIDHLLLALLDTPDTGFTSLSEIFKFKETAVREQLRSHLGLDSGIKPAMQAYDLCARIERDLKFTIIEFLKKLHGENWWPMGIPVKTRKRCSEIREEEGCVLDVESYLYLTDLRDIVMSNWNRFLPAMQSKGKSENKEKATAWMAKIGPIRNAVMHPGKREITIEDINELKDANNKTQAFCARITEQS